MTLSGERVEVERPANPVRKTDRRQHTYEDLRHIRMRAFLELYDAGFTIRELALLFRHTKDAVANELTCLLKMRAEMLADG